MIWLSYVFMLQWVIFAALVCIVTGMAYEIDASHAPASLVVTTHNPACTAVFLSGYNVTRQSDLLYNYEYHTNDYLNGNNITYTAYADEVSELVALLAARWEVTKVVAHSADEPPRLLAQLSNPDVSIFYLGFVSYEISEMLLQDAVDALRAADSIQSDSLVWVGIHTNNIARTWTYLEQNGAVIGQFGVGADGEGGGGH